jgi:hypothetical protein
VGVIVTGGTEDTLRLERGIQTYLGYPYSDRLHVATHHHNEPLVPRNLVKGVRERVDGFGEPAIPLYEDEARAAVEELRDAGVEGIVVSLLYSYRNSEHEDRIRELAAELAPDVPVFLASELYPMRRDFPRFRPSRDGGPRRHDLDRRQAAGANADLRAHRRCDRGAVPDEPDGSATHGERIRLRAAASSAPG